jgi:hypothetical protein
LKLSRTLWLLFFGLVAPFQSWADDKPITLTRTYKKGESARYKAESKITTPMGEAKLTGTSHMIVKEVKPDGTVVVDEISEGGKISLAGMDIDIPQMPATTLTRDKSGRLTDYKRPETLQSQEDPAVAKLMASIGTALLTDKPVKVGDSWETQVENPLDTDNKVKVKTTFTGLEKVDDCELWKIKQYTEASTGKLGGKLIYSGVYWLDPANGQEMKAEVDIKDLPSNFGLLTFQTKAARIKEEKKDK